MLRKQEIIVDFRRDKTTLHPLVSNGEEVEMVSWFKFLGILITEELKWTNTTAMVENVQQLLYFLRTLKQCNRSAGLLKSFYHCSTESVITYCITA